MQTKKIRTAAVKMGRLDYDWQNLLQIEAEDSIRIKLIIALAHRDGAKRLQCIALFLRDKNWKIHRAATEPMVAMKPESISLLQKNFHSNTAEVKAAAIQALNMLEQQEWVATRLTTTA
ncbi:MAG: HEAT repeat domain-containing protein [Desulfuromonas sp.]|nr:HEAT repeat domain-containing protein [Desulfuromonas sp.]